MNTIRFSLLAFFGLACCSVAAWSQPVDYQRVEAEGVGPSYDEALKQALIHAVAQVNGVAVAQRVFNRSAQGSAMTTTTTQSTDVTNTETHGAVVAVGATATRPSSGDQGTTVQATVVVGAGAAQSTSTSSGTQVTRKDFSANKKVIDSSAQTSGVVSRYQVVNSEKKDDGWHVLVLADIGVYKASAASERQKVAIVPFRLEKTDKDSSQFESALRADLIDRLTQSSKLAVLDREFRAEDQAELSLLTEGNARSDQAVRLGNALGADFLVVGTINDASIHTQSVYLSSVGKTISGPSTIRAKVTYRVIETATGQIHQADSWTAPGGTGSWDAVASLAAGEISARILDTLFPIRVERVADGIFYFGQGGDTVEVGQKYRVIKLGEAIIDSYTKEVIGREESEIGTVQVFEVEPKLAKARMIAGKPQADFGGGGNLIVRLIKEVPAPKTASGKTPVEGQPANNAKTLLQKEKENW